MAKTDFSKLNATLAKAAERKKNYENGGGKTFTKIEWGKIPFGDTTILVLPPKSDDVDWFHEVAVHHNYPDPEVDGKKRSYLCAKAVHGSCPMCDHVEELAKNGDTKRANDYRAQKTFLVNAMDQDGNVKVYPLKPSQHTEVAQEINTAYIDDDIDITDPANGKLIKISRLKAAPWARARVLGKQLEMAENKVTEVMSKLADLRTVYADISPADFVRVLNGEEVVYKSKNEDAEEAEEGVEDSALDTIKEIEESEAKAKAAAATKQRTDEEKIAAARAKAEAAKPAGTKAITPPGNSAAVAKMATATPKTAETVKAAPTPKVEAKAAPVEEKESTGDAELDAMLNDLDLK